MFLRNPARFLWVKYQEVLVLGEKNSSSLVFSPRAVRCTSVLFSSWMEIKWRSHTCWLFPQSCVKHLMLPVSPLLCGMRRGKTFSYFSQTGESWTFLGRHCERAWHPSCKWSPVGNESFLYSLYQLFSSSFKWHGAAAVSGQEGYRQYLSTRHGLGVML